MSDKTTIKPENRNRNEENRRQIIDFIADNGISDSKTVSKAIGADSHLQRHIGQTEWVCKACIGLRCELFGRTVFGQTGEWFLAKWVNEPSFMMVLVGVGMYEYRREDGVFIVPIGCLKD